MLWSWQLPSGGWPSAQFRYCAPLPLCSLAERSRCSHFHRVNALSASVLHSMTKPGRSVCGPDSSQTWPARSFPFFGSCYRYLLARKTSELAHYYQALIPIHSFRWCQDWLAISYEAQSVSWGRKRRVWSFEAKVLQTLSGEQLKGLWSTSSSSKQYLVLLSAQTCCAPWRPSAMDAVHRSTNPSGRGDSVQVYTKALESIHSA